LLSDETLKAWYSVDFDEIRIRSNFNFGATIATFGSTKYFAWNGEPS
jgi:RNA processing factor Prp31